MILFLAYVQKGVDILRYHAGWSTFMSFNAYNQESLETLNPKFQASI